MCIVHSNFLQTTALGPVILSFSSPGNAARTVAGLPAAARAVRELAAAGLDHCWIIAGEGWRPEPAVRNEVRRLAGAMQVRFVASAALPGGPAGGDSLRLNGEAIIAALPLASPLLALGCTGPGAQDDTAAAFDRAARRIVAATGKPGDGIVSRGLNRPVSQAISRHLLRFAAVRPGHATWLTAALAVAMMACLLSGSASGLIAGALLFQAASIADGIDGEIARATFRASHSGARIDSLVDAATNIGFIAGVVINLWIAGSRGFALAGATGLALMALGLWLIGRRAAKSGEPFTFNGVKDHFSARKSRLMQWLTWLTMRDFYAFAAVLFVLTGFTGPGLLAFAVVAAGWFAVVVTVTGAASPRTA